MVQALLKLKKEKNAPKPNNKKTQKTLQNPNEKQSRHVIFDVFTYFVHY